MILRIPPQQAAEGGYTVVDVREYPEYAAAAIPESALVPLAGVEAAAALWNKSRRLLLVCRTGRRAAQAAGKLAGLGFEHLAILEGGLEAWRAAGLRVKVSDRKPWSLERQVRVIAGAMVAVSTTLGLTVSPWFFAWTGFVVGGLVFAGVTDFCLMATILGRMPWNRPGQPAACGEPMSKAR